MKKIFNTVAMLAAVLLAGISCSQEIGVEVTPSANQPEKVHMSFTAGLSTKAFITDGATVDVSWNADDKIAVWDGTEWCEFAATSVDGSNAVFEGEITPKGGFEVTDFKAVYPYSAITNTSSEAISVSVPAAQVVPDGKFVDPAALVAVAPCNAEGLLSFTQVCALVKVTLKVQNLSAVTLDGTGFAGTVVCNPDGTISSSTARTDNITLTSATGTFPADAESGTDYYIAVLPSTTVLTVGMTRESDGYTGIRTTASAVTLEQGVAKAWIKDTAISSWEYNISTPEQLVACTSTWSEGFTSTVNLLADLDMSGVSYTGKNFGGTFNGNDHKIYNLAIETAVDPCFIRNLVGEVNHLTLGSSDGVSYDGSSALTIYDTEADDDWHYAAPIIRLKTPAVVDNVVNFIPVSVKAGTVVKTRIAGLIATVSSSPVTLIDCTNKGAVSNNATTASASSYIGGVAAAVDYPATFTRVHNRGAVTSDNQDVIYIGGLAASDLRGSSFYSCENSGAILITPSSLNDGCAIGGIIGEEGMKDGGGSYTVQDCINEGSIESHANSETKVGGIVGRSYIMNSEAVYTIKSCENRAEGEITITVASPSASLFVGGIIGNSPAASAGTFTIQSCKNYAAISMNNPRVSGLGGIAGFLNASSGAAEITMQSCENHGNITSSGEAAISPNIGGVIGYINAASSKPASIESCTNDGKVLLNSTKTTAYLGGIVGYSSYAVISECSNNAAGSVSCVNTYSSSNVLYIGGIFGRSIDGGVSYCHNYAHIFTDNTSGSEEEQVTVNRIGGIGGTLHRATSPLSNCTNSGKIEVDQSRALGFGNNWQAAGGIVGYIENVTVTVSDNTNSGAVDCKFNSSKANVSAGGIVGRFGGTITISNNVNSGTVSAVNVNTSGSYPTVACNAGGIIGSSNGGKTGSSVSGNVNHGAVSAGSTNTPTNVCAGGLIGWASIKNTFGTGAAVNKVYGTVSGTNPGAVAGKNAATIAVTLCDAVTVNSVTKAAAPDVDAWLCPANTGTITPTYVAHDAEEK